MLPYPGIPYGQAPAWCFPVFECSIYLLFILCMVHASRRDVRDVMYLLGGLAFGLVLEYIEVISHSYTYGRFIIMFGKAPMNIPLCIGAGWGIIMYTARLFTDSLKLSLLACAALDTLLALNIDLSMDTVAYRLHMWHWNWTGTGLNPLTAQWFGIPFGNFIGWQTVVFCYSAFSRMFEKKLLSGAGIPIYRFILTALLALICSQVVLYSTQTWLFPALQKYFHILSVHRLVAITVILLCLVFWGWRKKQVNADKIPMVAWWVPGWFHLFFFTTFFIFGFYTENTWMTIAACANIVIGLLVHFLPVLFGLNRKQQP